ncbi:helix-turn-helix transcriptional regulator [Catenuloplanes japonicus]|uniref:helix-turn-helix transcriptional regulator n=1 Tax=Catenuloplanes japonicus TaxID=33876 RepID=UPI000524AC09|nr:helix-turn-helix transcriptional regulator [Catenuloplanes japonicus]
MNDLGVALRAWRDRLDPASAGLVHAAPRRVSGLRRGELAMLAGISAEYVERLEQGRSTTPSAQVCAALARALQLTDNEQAHLMSLAGHAAGPDRVPRLIPSSLHRIMAQLEAGPLAVYDATWQLLHWNPLFAATFGDPTRVTDDGRNVLIMQFEGFPIRARQTPGERAEFEESLVADLRATTGRYPHDPDVAALVARLQRGPRFRALWARRAVDYHEHASKTVVHPDVGEIPLTSDVLATRGTDLRLVVHTARPGTDARGKLDLLAAIGLQRMTSR